MTHNIAILGKGNVGSALQRAFQNEGHKVNAVGSDPAAVQKAARDADMVVLAVPFGERKNALDEAGADNLKGKVIIDVTNALGADGNIAVDVRNGSGAEEVQGWASGAKVVKAFNTVFAQNMDKGVVDNEPLTVLVAGDDADAKSQVTALADGIGFDVVDAGPLEEARWLETMAILNIHLGYGQELGTDMGFRVVRPGAKQAGGRGKAMAQAQR